MAAVVVTLSGDDAQLFRSYQRVIEQANKLGAANRNTSKGSADAAKKAKEEKDAQLKAEREHIKTMERGKAMVESMRTPQESYNAAVEGTNDLHQKGAINDETRARKLQQLKTRLEEQTGVTARNAAVEKARLDVISKNGQVTDRAAAAINKYEAELVELDRKQEAGAISAQELARAQQRVRGEFDKSVGLADKQNQFVELGRERLGQYATAAGVAALAVRGITAAYETLNAEQQKGLEALRKTEDTSRALLQISETPEDFASMRDQAQQLATQEGVDIATVQRVMFSAVSEGFRDALPEIIAANQIIAPESAAGVAGQAPALFQGAIGAMEAVNLTLKAADASRLNFEDIAKSLPAAAAGGAIAKATPEEVLSVLSVMASRFKSGDVAADRLKGFATKAGIDAGETGATDEELAEKEEKERERVARESKSLRSKEERVADLEKRLASSRKDKDKESVQAQLDRARRDVAEFDRSKLEFKAPERGETRESFAGQGIIKVVERLDAMTKEQRSEYLKDSMELNEAYVILSEELPTIKARMAEIVQERADFAGGGGILQGRLAIAAQDEQLAAIKENNRATVALDETYRSERGIIGATADTAVKEVDRAIINDGNFGARMLNATGAAGLQAQAGVFAGVDRQESVSRAVAASEIVGAGGPFSLEGIKLIVGELRRATGALTKSADAQENAAAAQKAASKQPIPFKPVTDAARAGLANQGGS